MSVLRTADLIGRPFANSAGVAGLNCYGLVREVYHRAGLMLPEEPAFVIVGEPHPSAEAAPPTPTPAKRVRCGPVEFIETAMVPQAGDILVEEDPARGPDARHVSVAISPFEVVESVSGVGVRRTKMSSKRRAGHILCLLRPVGMGLNTQDCGAEGETAPVRDLCHGVGAVGDFNTAILLAIAVASMIASRLLAPRPRLAPLGSDSADGSRYGFNRFSRDAVAGEPIPVVLGRLPLYGGALVSANPTIEDDQGNSRLRMLVCLGEGEFASIAGRTSDFDDVDAATLTGLEINDQPASNFVGVRAWGRMGTPTQATIPGFADTEVPREVGVSGVLLRNTDGVERTGGSASGEAYTLRTNQQVNAAVVRIRFSQGLYSLAGETAQLEPRTVKYRVRTRPVVSGTPGSWSSWTVVTVTRAERAELFASRRFDSLADPAEVQDIQVERVSVESDDATVADTMLWDAAVEVVYSANAYAGCGLLALEITAGEQINGSAPRVAAAVDGAKVRVWDGVSDPGSPVFTTAWSNNPAYLALEVLTNQTWGLGATYTDDDVDFGSLFEWAAYCAEEVERSDGGVRPRFAYNRALTSDADGIEVLRSICEVGRCTPIKVGGIWSFVVDKEQATPVEKFTDGSIAVDDDGAAAFEYTRIRTTGGRTTPNRVVIQFENDRARGEADTAGWPETGTSWLATEPLRERSERVDGLTDPDQAAAEAVYRCKRLRLRSRSVSFTTTRPLVSGQPGERFDLAMSLPGWGTASGRVRAGCTTTSILIDETVDLAADTVYQLDVVHADGTLETRTVTSPAGTYGGVVALTVDPAFSTAPATHAEYALGETGIQTKPFLYESVALVDAAKMVWEVKGVEYVAAVYDASDAIPPETRYSSLDGNLAAPGPVTDIRAAERFIAERLRVELAWAQEPDDRRRTGSYRIFRRVVGTSTWQPVPNPTITTNGAAIDITEQDRAYEFCVIAVSVSGAALSPYDPRIPIATLVMGLAEEPPPAPTGLTAENTEGNTYRLYWDAVEGATSYAVLVGGEATSLPNAGAEDCIVLSRVTDPEITGLELAPGQDYAFWVRSVNSSGRLSFDAASVTITGAATPPGKTIKTTRAFDLSTEGTLSNLSWTSSRLRLTNANNPGTWTGPWEDLSTSTLSELTLKARTVNDATDPATNTDPFTAPSIAADQWGIVSVGPPVVGMLFPPWPDREHLVGWEVRTSDGVVDSDWQSLALFSTFERTFRKFQLRATLSRDHAPYRPGLVELVAVVTE